ncbi:hypothetical protein J2X36_004001 [Methylobacterium sp. BE186]|uniref:hypothetical protein n=1 Tax=Methylobacterium sp. BE186 TaxID=2817715 RepID=UPI00285CC96E|nr:hypothetical protein [Methylobacterium sp. BE186]MDR7039228.1 hypothetical protein [Methylobacterium sp. BE186]
MKVAPGSAVMPSPAEIAQDWLTALLSEDEAERREGDPRQQFQTAEERERRWPNLVKVPRRGIGRDLGSVQGLELQEQHAAYAEALGRSDPEIADGEVRAYRPPALEVFRPAFTVWPDAPARPPVAERPTVPQTLNSDHTVVADHCVRATASAAISNEARL